MVSLMVAIPIRIISTTRQNHTTLLLALPAVKIWQIFRIQVDGLARRSMLFLSYNYRYSLTCDMWHVTWDTSQVTCDTPHVTYIVWKLQVPSSNGLRDTGFWRYFHKPLMIKSASYRGVCRTASATPGLLSIQNTALVVKEIPLWYFWQEIYLDGLGWNSFILESAFLVLKNYYVCSILSY